jgi:adenylate cyclase
MDTWEVLTVSRKEVSRPDKVAGPGLRRGSWGTLAPDRRRALRYHREALVVAEEVGEPQLLFPCYDGLATLHLDLDDLAGAETYMQKARSVCEEAGVEPDSLTVLPFLA